MRGGRQAHNVGPNRRLLTRSAGELSTTWRELLAVEQVVCTAAEAFEVEEPILPETQELLDEIRKAALALVAELKPDFGELLLREGPHERVFEMLSTIIANQASVG